MKRRYPQHSREERDDTVTVSIGSYNGTQIDITYRTDATVWPTNHGTAGLVSGDPTEVLLTDASGERQSHRFPTLTEVRGGGLRANPTPNQFRGALSLISFRRMSGWW